MKWWVLALSLFCLLSMAEAGGRDSDGDGISDVGKKDCSLTYNLFVTSKIEFSNPPILKFKVLLKIQRALYNPFLMVY